jgi:hypothetical protein
MGNNSNIISKDSNAKFFYVLIFAIVLTLFYNYFFKVTNYSNQINNYILITIVTGLVFMLIFKRKVPMNKIYKITLYAFLAFLIIYLLFGTRINYKFKINSLHSLIILFSISIGLYLIYTFASANL